MRAARIAVEIVDQQLGRLLHAIKKAQAVALITADHGNADEMFMWDKKTKDFAKKEDGSFVPKTSHTLSPVPLFLYDARGKAQVALRPIEDAGLSNVAATAFELLGFEAPEDYRHSLLKA